MTTWLTGASGMLGKVFHKYLSDLEIPVIPTDIELEIGNAQKVKKFSQEQPLTHIINCAAYTQVDLAEQEASEARRTNAEGPFQLGQAAIQSGASLIHFSTDYVFDGKATRPYREDDSCFPQNIYGETKREGERSLLATMDDTVHPDRRVYIVRTSWLFGEGGMNFVRTMLRLMAEREVLQVVADQTGRPTYRNDLVDVSIRLLGLEEQFKPNASIERGIQQLPPSGIYHFANSGSTTWYGFATQIHEFARALNFPIKTKTIEPIETSLFPRPAVRPAYSVLATERIETVLGIKPRSWQSSLYECMKKIKVQSA